jgi:hypothetical protein
MTAGGSALGSPSVVRWWNSLPGVGTTQDRGPRVDRDPGRVDLRRRPGAEPLGAALHIPYTVPAPLAAHSADGSAKV